MNFKDFVNIFGIDIASCSPEMLAILGQIYAVQEVGGRDSI
jgi:hypothetical protein